MCISIATVTAVRATPSEVAANDRGVVIDLRDTSRFEFAVAGTVQLPANQPAPAGPATATTQPQGVTVDFSTSSSTTSTTTTQPSATTSSASVTILNGETTSGRRGVAALDTIRYPWEEALDGWTITFLPANASVSGLVHFDRRVIEVYVRSSHTDAKLAHVLAHEIGHVVDWRFVSGPERGEWIAARGLGSRSWYPSSGSFDFSSPAGDFAEAFAVWQTGGTSYSQIGGAVTASDIELLERITSF